MIDRHDAPAIPRKPLLAAVLFLIASQAASACAQQRIFLPTWHFFRTGGTYLVPDRGTLNTGGTRSRRAASRRTGLPGLGTPFTRNRSYGRSSAARGTQVTATIHDLRAMDESIRGADRLPPAARSDTLARQTRGAVEAAARDAAGAMSLAEIRRRAKRHTRSARR